MLTPTQWRQWHLATVTALGFELIAAILITLIVGLAVLSLFAPPPVPVPHPPTAQH